MGIPYVTDVLPATALDPETPIQATLLDQVDFVRVVVSVWYPSLRFEEVVWTGTVGIQTQGEFLPAYETHSTVVPAIDGGDYGVTFTILRSPVWPDAPQVRIYAVDVDGAEV